jgi:hypothetical protein
VNANNRHADATNINTPLNIVRPFITTPFINTRTFIAVGPPFIPRAIDGARIYASAVITDCP